MYSEITINNVPVSSIDALALENLVNNLYASNALIGTTKTGTVFNLIEYEPGEFSIRRGNEYYMNLTGSSVCATMAFIGYLMLSDI